MLFPDAQFRTADMSHITKSNWGGPCLSGYDFYLSLGGVTVADNRNSVKLGESDIGAAPDIEPPLPERGGFWFTGESLVRADGTSAAHKNSSADCLVKELSNPGHNEQKNRPP